jgi:ABC-type ATPase involved in cell division
MSFNSPFTGNVIQPTDVSYRRIILTTDLQLEWPINGSVADDAAARIMEVSTASTANELWMPPANQASVGQDALIRNVGAVALLVKDYTGLNTIVSIAAGQAQYIYITANPTTAGTWGIIAYGIGSSGADAATLAGYGLLAIGQTLNQSQPVTTFSSNYTALTTDRSSTYVWTGGAGTLTLDSAATLGDNWFMFLRNGGTGALTVSGTGGNTINGSGSIIFQPSDSAIIVCSGSTFYTVGLGKNTQFAFTQLTKAVTTGTVTLTSTEASNVIQKYTGTLTGNVTIIVPQTVQVYYVQNATNAGAFTLTISTGVGSASTATIAAGNQATLICDSVNLVNANTVLAGSSAISLINGTVSNPSLNFASEPTTGIYRAASGEFNHAILGVLRSTLSASGLAIVGTGNFTGGVSGGVFT